MTIRAVEWAMRQALPPTAKLVLIMLADCINSADEFAYPKRERIAAVVGRQERQVRNHVRALEEMGLIRCVQGAGAGRGQGRRSARYYLACDHRTGENRPFTAGNQAPPEKVITAGNLVPPVSVTAGNLRSLQPAICGLPYKKEPEKEPELTNVLTAPKPRRVKSPYTTGFQTYWEMWPRPRRELSDKRKAFERWQDALKIWPEETIIRATKGYLAKPDVRKEGFKYCRLAQVFLNGGLEAAIEAADAVPSGKLVWSTELHDWVTEAEYSPSHGVRT